jgi:hypothetical protein
MEVVMRNKRRRVEGTRKGDDAKTYTTTITST